MINWYEALGALVYIAFVAGVVYCVCWAMTKALEHAIKRWL